MNALAAELRQRLRMRAASVGVVGLGYVGIPLATAFARAGLVVLGGDADRDRADTRNLTGPLGRHAHVVRLERHVP